MILQAAHSSALRKSRPIIISQRSPNRIFQCLFPFQYLVYTLLSLSFAPWPPIALAIGEKPVASPQSVNPTEKTTTPSASFELLPFAAGYVKPVQLVISPDAQKNIFVVCQSGPISLLEAGDEPSKQMLLDTTEILAGIGSEAGLLGMAFHPEYTTNGKFYLHYLGKNRVLENRVSEFVAVSGRANLESERKLIRLQINGTEHPGGNLQFGPDNFLYVGIGDAGGKNDPEDRAQNRLDLFGALLRIDPEETGEQKKPYKSPPDNPYVKNKLGDSDVYAIGLRNPKTFTFDPVSKLLLLGDSGQGGQQEIDIIRSGGNYGWSIFDGSECLRMRFECLDKAYQAPILSYTAEKGSAIIVGMVYSGSKFPTLHAALLYADRTSGFVWVLKSENGKFSSTPTLLLDSQREISAIQESKDGDIFLADYKSGEVLKLAALNETTAPAKPPIRNAAQ